MTAARLLAMSRAGRSSDQVSADDHGLLRLVGSLQFGIGGLLLLVVLVIPDPDRSDHVALSLLAGFGLVGAIVRWSSHRSSTLVARSWNIGCIVYVAAIVAVSRPVGLGAFLMLWPVLSTAYFLGRRDLVLVLVLMTGALDGALRLNPDPATDPLLQLVTAVSVIGSASVLMVLLRERVDVLITDLERTASTDGLTGLANRTAWNAAFATEIERARRTGAPLSVAIFDLDRFKAINDCLGHAEGDRALVRFSSLLATECRSFDIPGRLGGEEFGLLLVGATADGARAFAERLRGRLELVTQHDLTTFTVSTGVAELDVHAEDATAMMLAADRALYRAKAEGRDRVIIADLPKLAPLPIDDAVARDAAADGPQARQTAAAEAPADGDPLDALDALGQSAEQLSLSVTLKLEPQPQAATTLGFSTLKPAPVIASTKSITEPST